MIGCKRVILFAEPAVAPVSATKLIGSNPAFAVPGRAFSSPRPDCRIGYARIYRRSAMSDSRYAFDLSGSLTEDAVVDFCTVDRRLESRKPTL